MKFGIFDFGMWHETQSPAEVIRNVVDDATLADALGFDTFWLGEHHFTRHGIYGNTLTLAAHLAARTSTIRLGTAVVVLPLHHPIRVAEEAAMVDVLSNGRLDLGLGAGYQRLEFDGMGIDINESRARFKETLELLLHAWQDTPFEFEGTFYRRGDDGREIQVLPKPTQSPHPPVYIAVSTSPETIEFAAELGFPIMVGGPTDIMGIAPQVVQRWQEAMGRHGKDASGIDIPCAKGIYVAPTDAEAEADIAAVDSQWDLKLLAQIGSPISAGGEIPPGYEHWEGRHKDRAQWTAESTTSTGSAALIGSPETVAERLADLGESGLTSIFGGFGLPGMPHRNVQRSIELFGKEVLPRFK
jgi:alkanesulfonate monooxygenase SsuD/methylene tetrahydromethanopterin reductase-like flavin-dependent oxidoreductase (luciferase family)